MELLAECQSGQGGPGTALVHSLRVWRLSGDMMEHMKESHADWLAVPFGSSASQLFRVRGIPAVRVVHDQ